MCAVTGNYASWASHLAKYNFVHLQTQKMAEIFVSEKQVACGA